MMKVGVTFLDHFPISRTMTLDNLSHLGALKEILHHSLNLVSSQRFTLNIIHCKQNILVILRQGLFMLVPWSECYCSAIAHLFVSACLQLEPWGMDILSCWLLCVADAEFQFDANCYFDLLKFDSQRLLGLGNKAVALLQCKNLFYLFVKIGSLLLHLQVHTVGYCWKSWNIEIHSS